MIAWELLGRAEVPGNDVALSLFKRGRGVFDPYGRPRAHEQQAAWFGGGALRTGVCQDRPPPRDPVLIGGLGWGLRWPPHCGGWATTSRVDVAELVPEVVVWNRGTLAPLAGHPLADPRVTVLEVDVVRTLREGQRVYDAILLDWTMAPRT